MKKLLATLSISALFLSACASSDLNSNSPTTMDNGLIIEILEEGNGAVAEKGDTVDVHYSGELEDGTPFDSSIGDSPFRFEIGAGMVIQGWDEGIPGMKVGEKRKLTIPSDLGYGDRGFPGAIPGGATLIFEVELMEIL